MAELPTSENERIQGANARRRVLGKVKAGLSVRSRLPSLESAPPPPTFDAVLGALTSRLDEDALEWRINNDPQFKAAFEYAQSAFFGDEVASDIALNPARAEHLQMLAGARAMTGLEQAHGGSFGAVMREWLGLQTETRGFDGVRNYIDGLREKLAGNPLVPPAEKKRLEAEWERVNALPERERVAAARSLRYKQMAEIEAEATFLQGAGAGMAAFAGHSTHSRERWLTAATLPFTPFHAVRGAKGVALSAAAFGGIEAGIVAPDAIVRANIRRRLAEARNAEQEEFDRIENERNSEILIGASVGFILGGLAKGATEAWRAWRTPADRQAAVQKFHRESVDSNSTPTEPPPPPTETTINIVPEREIGGDNPAKVGRVVDEGAEGAEQITISEVGVARISRAEFDDVIGDDSGEFLARYISPDEDDVDVVMDDIGRVIFRQRAKPEPAPEPAPPKPDDPPPEVEATTNPEPVKMPDTSDPAAYDGAVAARETRLLENVPPRNTEKPAENLTPLDAESAPYQGFRIGGGLFANKLSDEGEAALPVVQDLYNRLASAGDNPPPPERFFEVQDGRVVMRGDLSDEVREKMLLTYSTARNRKPEKDGSNSFSRLLDGEQKQGDLADTSPEGVGDKSVEEFSDDAAAVLEEVRRRATFHGQRRALNVEFIPPGHFSMLNEIYDRLIYPLEEMGIELPERMIPDISTGLRFNKFLRKHGIDPAEFAAYRHRFVDGRTRRDARLYPLKYREALIDYFENEWLPNVAPKYLKQRKMGAAADAIPSLPKVDLPPAESPFPLRDYEGRVAKYGEPEVARAIGIYGRRAGEYFNMRDAIDDAEPENTPLYREMLDYAFDYAGDTKTRAENFLIIRDAARHLPDNSLTRERMGEIVAAARAGDTPDVIAKRIEGVVETGAKLDGAGNVVGKNVDGEEVVRENVRVVDGDGTVAIQRADGGMPPPPAINAVRGVLADIRAIVDEFVGSDSFTKPHRTEMAAKAVDDIQGALARLESGANTAREREAVLDKLREIDKYSDGAYTARIRPLMDSLWGAEGLPPPRAPEAGARSSVAVGLRLAGLPHEAVSATDVPVSSIKVNVARFQQRKDIIPDSEGLKKDDGLEAQRYWDPGLANVITVWVDKSGQRWLADGHQRLGLAKRSGQKTLRYVDELHEADGWTADLAFVYVAWKNLNVEKADGWWDAAHFARRVNESTDPNVQVAERALREGLKLDALKQMRNSLTIGESVAKLEDSAFWALEGLTKTLRGRGGQIKMIADRTAGRWTPEIREKSQRKLIEYAALKRHSDLEMAQRIQTEIDNVNKRQAPQGDQENLLGNFDEVREDFIADIRSGVAGEIMKRLRADAKLLTTAARRGIIEKIKETGGEVDVAALRAEKISNDELMDWLELQLTDVGERSPLKNAIADEAEALIDEVGVDNWKQLKVKERTPKMSPIADRLIARIDEFYTGLNDARFSTVEVSPVAEKAAVVERAAASRAVAQPQKIAGDEPVTDEVTGVTYNPLVLSDGALAGRIMDGDKDIGVWTPGGEGSGKFRAMIARDGDTNFSKLIEGNTLRELSDKIQTAQIELEAAWRKANGKPMFSSDEGGGVLTAPARSRQDPTPGRTGNKTIPPLKNQTKDGRGILTGGDGRPVTQGKEADPLLQAKSVLPNPGQRVEIDDSIPLDKDGNVIPPAERTAPIPAAQGGLGGVAPARKTDEIVEQHGAYTIRFTEGGRANVWQGDELIGDFASYRKGMERIARLENPADQDKITATRLVGKCAGAKGVK